jgi:prepilin-type processing-associated H-X9-DG protein
MRRGFTRIELAVATGVLFLSAGLILPRVQAARADAARTQCANNLRKLGQGFAEFEKANAGFPARRGGFNNGAPYCGWGAHVLPYIGEEAIAKKYNMKLDFFDPANKAAVETQVKTFLCPSSPADRVVTIQSQASAKSENADKDTVFTVKAGACDYISSNGTLMARGGYGINANTADAMIGNQRQPMTDNDFLPNSKITDGTSCTILLIEQAGRPNVWRNGKKKDSKDMFGMSPNARGSWARWGSIAFGPSSATTGETSGNGDATDCTVNCNNSFGIYAFHTEGANILLCDGSVRFVSPKLDPLTFIYLSIRDDGHLIDPNDY